MRIAGGPLHYNEKEEVLVVALSFIKCTKYVKLQFTVSIKLYVMVISTYMYTDLNVM
jgi:hypothetical protein